MAGMRMQMHGGLKRFTEATGVTRGREATGFTRASVGSVAALVVVCGLSAGVAYGGAVHGGAAPGGLGDSVGRLGTGVGPGIGAVSGDAVTDTGGGGGGGFGGFSGLGGVGSGLGGLGVGGFGAGGSRVTAGPGAVVPAAPGASGAEADLSYHGHVSLWAGRVGVWVEPSNHGPAAVPDATVRLRFSVPLTGAEELPPGCLHGSPDTVLCSTGAMRAAGEGRPIALDLRVAGSPVEVVVNINTSWSGGVGDRNPDNNTHRVLAPATGDKYAY